MLFVALFVSAFVSYASAQESYPPTGQDDGGYTVLDALKNAKVASVTHGNDTKRYFKAFPLAPYQSGTQYGAKQRLEFNPGITFVLRTEYPVYNNLTYLKSNYSGYNDAFSFKVGQSVKLSAAKGDDVSGYEAEDWDGAWMSTAIFLDADRNGAFVTSERLANKTGVDGLRQAPEFRLPTDEGTYRIRFVAGDDSNNPAGSTSVLSSGGMIVDANITLVRPTVTYNYSSRYVTVTPSTADDNLVCGENYTFTVTPKSGCEVTSVTARVGDETVSQDINLASSNGTYTVPAANFQNDMVITIEATKNSTLTAADAANGNCYFRLKSYRNKYLKCGISNVTASDGSQYVQEGTKYLYTWDPNDESEKSKQASYIWRLVKDGSSTYMTSQGYRVGAIGTGADRSVQMTTEGKAITCSVNSSSKYTFTTGEKSYTSGYSGSPYLHEVVFGRDNNNGKYPNNDEGLHVSSWSASADASQWTIEPIESFTVTIGKGGWSSFNYAFPIAFSTDEVSNVYISTSENTGVVTLAPIAAVDGMISVPSNTPIFVEGTEGKTCTVDLLTIEPTAVSGNTLRGTTLPQTATLNENQTAYVIATVDDKTALYKLGAGVKIPCNKAYYVSSQASTAKLELNFGEVTEISNAVTAQPALKDEILYDLSGHRVVYPTRGIYVTGSGRKIFVK